MFKYSANYVLIAGLSVVDTVVAFVYSTLLLSYDVCCLHNAYALEVCGSTRTRGYGSGTGRCLTGRVGYGYEVHGYGYTRFYP